MRLQRLQKVSQKMPPHQVSSAPHTACRPQFTRPLAFLGSFATRGAAELLLVVVVSLPLLSVGDVADLVAAAEAAAVLVAVVVVVPAVPALLLLLLLHDAAAACCIQGGCNW